MANIVRKAGKHSSLTTTLESFSLDGLAGTNKKATDDKIGSIAFQLE